jgi:hypothetical protein
VTAADDWAGFGDGTAGGTTLVRVDQGSVRIDFKSADPVNDANTTVTLTLDGGAGPAPAGITFGGQQMATVSTVLDANGVGSITITPDAFTVQDGDQIVVGGTFAQTLVFQRAAPDSLEAEQDPYFGMLDGSVTIVATVFDQFGLPFTTGFAGAQRPGTGTGTPNTDAAPQLKPVGANGETSFTFTDTTQTADGVDDVNLMWFEDQFSPAPDATGLTHIKWTVDGMGANFVTSLEGNSTEDPTYTPATVTIIPLADTVANAADEAATLAVASGEPNATVDLSVDGGAMLLAPGETTLAQGAATGTDTLDGAGALPAGWQIIGTESGVVTLTVTAAGRTETAQFTVGAQTDVSKARNVTVSGPAEVPAGTDQITFTAVITDAFGNGIGNIPVSALNIQVTGDASFQDSDAVTNAAGEINLNVRVDDDAVGGDVTITVTGLPGAGNQFGAAANRLQASSATDDGMGLTASSNVATATTAVVPKVGLNLKLSGSSKGKKDKIKVNANDNGAGLVAKLFRGGKKIGQHALNNSGGYTFTVKDKNGKKVTKYTVKIAATPATKAASTPIKTK